MNIDEARLRQIVMELVSECVKENLFDVDQLKADMVDIGDMLVRIMGVLGNNPHEQYDSLTDLTHDVLQRIRQIERDLYPGGVPAGVMTQKIDFEIPSESQVHGH